MMTADEKSHGIGEPVIRNSRWLIGSTAVLLVAVVAMGAWILVGFDGTSDVEQLTIDYRTAWENNDPEALLELVTSDFRMTDVWADDTYNVRTIADELGGFAESGAEWIEVGSVTAYGDWAVVPETVTFMGDTFEFTGVSVFRIKDGLIASHYAVTERTR